MQEKLKYIKLWEDRLQRLAQLGMVSELEAAVHEFKKVVRDREAPLDVDESGLQSMSSSRPYDYQYDLGNGYSQRFADEVFGDLSYTEQIEKLGQTWIFDEAGDADEEELENQAENQMDANWDNVYVEPSLLITENHEVRVLGVFNGRSGPDDDFNGLTDPAGYPVEALGFSEQWLTDFYRALTDYIETIPTA